MGLIFFRLDFDIFCVKAIKITFVCECSIYYFLKDIIRQDIEECKFNKIKLLQL